MKEKISFKDLSGWLKTVVVFGWLWAGYFTLIFLIGFITGIQEALI